MKINIQGRIVEVDDSFAQLSAEEQNRTVDEIAKSLNINAGKAQQPEPKTPFFERVKQVVTEPTRAVEPAKTVATSPTTGNLSSPALTALNLIQRGLGLSGAQDLLRGAAETAATVGTGLGSQVLGAMGGVAEAMRGGAPKLGTPESNRLAIERAKQIQQGATYQPRTEMGQEMLGGLASGLEASRIPPYLAGIPPNVAASAARQAQPGIQQAARAAAQPIVSAAQAPRNVIRGFVNPEQGLKQIEPTMVKPQAVQQFLDEKLNARQVLNPENLVQTDEVLKSDLDKLARIISNDQVPYTGKLSEAFGARMREAYEHPYGGWLEGASLLATGFGLGIPLPLSAMSKATKTLSDLYLQRKLGYNPRFASEFERRAAQEAEQQAMTQRSAGPVMPSTGISGVRMPEIYNIQTGPYSVPKGTGADAFSSGYAQQVSGITTTPPPGPSPIRITQPMPTAQTAPSPAAMTPAAPTQAAPTNIIAQLDQQISSLGLKGDAAKNAVINSRAQQLIKENKAKGIVLSKEDAKAIAIKESETFFGEKTKTEAQLRSQAFREKQAKQQAEAEALEAARKATPEYQARVREIEELEKDPYFAKEFNDFANAAKTRTYRDTALDDQAVLNKIKERVIDQKKRDAEQAARQTTQPAAVEKSKNTEDIIAMIRARGAAKSNQPAPGPVEPFRVEVSGTAETMTPAEKQLAAQAKADANRPVTNAERLAEMMEEAEFLRAEKAKKEAAKASEVSGPVVPSTMAETTTPIIAPKTKTGMAALEEFAPELAQPVIKKPPKITPQTSPLPAPRAPRNDLYSFPVKQYVQTYSRGGTRKLYDTVLNDIAEKTGITIDPKSIEDISKMTPKEAQSAVANAYRKAVKEHLANPRNTVTVSVIDPKTKTLTKKQMPDIFE